MNTLTDAALQDINASSLMAALPDPLAKESPDYIAEYGMRADDNALVFHFFPPKGDSWDPKYQMDFRVKRAIDKVFDIRRVSADYVEEVRSFCVIYGGAHRAPDPLALAARFFEWVEAPLEAAS